jgi:hypothetical protein
MSDLFAALCFGGAVFFILYALFVIPTQVH